ncbi:MAG: hypothetical protein CM1200mP22_33830 [Dehalococcoidia bacterium]|nr:MAG: hypothetical protein CM1200mP22_33830 [Dehalococcoidia bacterium]
MTFVVKSQNATADNSRKSLWLIEISIKIASLISDFRKGCWKLTKQKTWTQQHNPNSQVEQFEL